VELWNHIWLLLICGYPGGGSKMRKLVKYSDYTREEVQQIFEPDYSYVSGAGTWGIMGVVSIPYSNDFVFFVTYGSSQAGHIFQEGVTKDGLITWQSQPNQKLSDYRVKRWITHDPSLTDIYLFLRTSKIRPFTYMGKLAYVWHDPDRECPVYFKWQILDWELTQKRANEIGLVFCNTESLRLDNAQLLKRPIESVSITESLRQKNESKALSKDNGEELEEMILNLLRF
jgi:hypothetical protein